MEGAGWGGGGDPEKTSGDEHQKMPYTKPRRFQPQARLEPSQYHWWQARKADVLTVTRRVALRLTSFNRPNIMLWYFRDGSAEAFVHTATLR